MSNTNNTTCECGRCLAVVDCGDGVTRMALALEIAMMCDTAAQDRYLAIYGVAWVGFAGAALEGKSVAPSTTSKTVR